VVYFPKPEKVGRNEKGSELERDSRYAGERKLLDLVEGDPEPRHAVEHPPPAGDGELEKRIEETSQRILIIEKALNGIAGSLEKMVLLSARNIEKLDVIETVVLKMAGHYLGK
jgi:hypothetical protein